MTKHSYQDKLRTQLRQWQDRIDQLRAHVGQAGSESRRHFQEQIEDLQAKQKAANRKLDELARTHGSVRKTARRRINAAGSRIQQVIRRVVSAFR